MIKNLKIKDFINELEFDEEMVLSLIWQSAKQKARYVFGIER